MTEVVEVPADVVETIETVVSDLDIYRIREVMKWLDMRVPTQNEIYTRAVDLLENAYLSFINSPDMYPSMVQSWGLTARCHLSPEGVYIFDISYDITSATNVE